MPNKNHGKKRKYITTDEVVDLTRLSKATIYKLAAQGEIPVRRLRRRLLFPSDEIEEWIENEGAVQRIRLVGGRLR